MSSSQELFEGFDDAGEYSHQIYELFGNNPKMLNYRFKNEPKQTSDSSSGIKEVYEKLANDIEKSNRGLVVVFDYAPNLRHHLRSFETAVTTPSPNILYGIIRILFIVFRVRWNYILMLVRLRRALKVTALRSGWTDNVLKKHKKDAHRYVAAYLLLVKKIVLFSFYERLFAKWHIFHLPLFIMLVITGLVHVVSVHMY